jgi:hypothetical protein
LQSSPRKPSARVDPRLNYDLVENLEKREHLRVVSWVRSGSSGQPPGCDRLLENWIDESEKRTWFLFECTRHA